MSSGATLVTEPLSQRGAYVLLYRKSPIYGVVWFLSLTFAPRRIYAGCNVAGTKSHLRSVVRYSSVIHLRGPRHLYLHLIRRGERGWPEFLWH